MQPQKSSLTVKKKIILSLVIFAVCYLTSLIIWVKIQDHYGKGLLSVASHLTAYVKDVEFKGIMAKDGNKYGALFNISRQDKRFLTFITFDFSLFTYNAPLTFAIMAALFLFIKKHLRAYTEVLIILVAIHIFYIFLSEAGRIATLLDQNNLESSSEVGLFIWQYLWGFIDAMFIRFEPFLIGIYLFLRFAPSPVIPKVRRKNKKGASG